MHSLFEEISLIIAIAAGISLVMRLLKQPLIIGYIITGIITGPSILHLIESEEIFESFSAIGIVLLLFIVGLGLNPKVIKEVGKVSVLTGTGQVVATTIIGILLALAMGVADREGAIFIGVGMAFSSTIIILKLLSDKKEQNRLHGKISIGVLLVQDILATIALLYLSASDGGGLSVIDLLVLIVKGGWLGIILYLVATHVLPKLGKLIAGSQEFLFLFAIAWGFGVATLFELVGFSIEVGALFAGVMLAALPYAQEMSSRLRPLRDFFIVVFFITLGAGLNLNNIADEIVPAIILSAAVLIGNPIVIMIILGLIGYTKRTAFQVGVVMAQISEFSLIFLILAERQGRISEEILTLMTLVALITIAVSTYMILYTDKLYMMFERYLNLFERRSSKPIRDPIAAFDAIVFGYQKGGKEFVKSLQKLKKRTIVVDYDPSVIDHLEHTKIDYLYGDANDPELLEELGIEKTKIIISVVTDFKTNEFILKHSKHINKSVITVLLADNRDEAAALYKEGASYVMLPHVLGSEKIGHFLEQKGLKSTEFKKFREKHIKSLTR